MLILQGDPEVAIAALARAATGSPVRADEYNSLLAILALERDALSRLETIVSMTGVPVTLPGVREPVTAPRYPVLVGPTGQREAAIVGWAGAVPSSSMSTPAVLSAQRLQLASAIGYSMQRLRESRRILRSTSAPTESPRWSRLFALTGEPDIAALHPSAIAPEQHVSLDPSVATSIRSIEHAARSTIDRSFAALRQVPVLTPADSLAQTGMINAVWMGREYETSGGRAELVAYATIALGVLVALGVLGAFDRGPDHANDRGAGPVSPGYGMPRVTMPGMTMPFSGF